MTLVWDAKASSVDVPDPDGTTLLDQARAMARREPAALAILGLDPSALGSDRELLMAVAVSTLPDARVREAVSPVLRDVLFGDPEVVVATLCDVAATTLKNFEPGGGIATLMFSRGVQAILAHRIAHALWDAGRFDLALSVKTVFSRVFATDIHPGARFGRGIWLDHGVGFVVGETCVIEENVNIWHGVTLGSTLKHSGEGRHPRLRRGCTVGAGSVILGGIEVGAGSIVAAGSVVLADVPPGATVAGVPARRKGRPAASSAGTRT